MRRYLPYLLLLALPLLLGCGLHLLPVEQPPIPPPVDCRVVLCAPGTHCEPGSGCVADPVDPPGSPVCSAAVVTDCWQYTGGEWSWRDCRESGCPDGQSCEAGHADIYACRPDPCAACPPDTTCQVVEGRPVGCLPTAPPLGAAPLIADEDLQLVPSDTRKVTWGLTWAALERWRARHPEAWRADGACLVNGPSGIDAAFQAVADELLAVGVVAGQSITRDGVRSDAIFVTRPGTTDECEETHLFDYSRGCVATGSSAIKHMYVRGGAPPAQPPPPAAPPPTIPPPAGDGCGDPAPPALFKLRVVVHRAFCADIDTTPLVKGAAYCAAVGFTDGRSVCAVRAEGAPDRAACEHRITGDQTWACGPLCDVLPCRVPGNCDCGDTQNRNVSQAKVVGHGTVTSCDATGAVCGEVVQ